MTTSTMASSDQSWSAGEANSLVWFVTLLDKTIVALASALALSAIGLMFVALIVEVVIRYMTNQGLGWPTELPNLLFPWLVMCGVVLAAQRGQHIAVTAILNILNRKATRALLLALQLTIATTFFYLAYVSLDVIEITGSEVYPVTGISAHWAYLALLVGFIGVGITALTTIIHLLHTADPLSVRAHVLQEEV